MARRTIKAFARGARIDKGDGSVGIRPGEGIPG